MLENTDHADALNNLVSKIKYKKTVDICNTTVTLDPVSGAWHTGSEPAPTSSGVCEQLNNGTGIVSNRCATYPFESYSVYTDLLRCSTDVCDGF